MAVEGKNFSLLEGLISLSCEMKAGLEAERKEIARKIADKLYQTLKDKPDWNISEFREAFMQVAEEIPFPIDPDLNLIDSLRNLKDATRGLITNLYESLVEEENTLKFKLYFAWIDGLNLINEIIGAIIKTYRIHRRKREMSDGMAAVRIMVAIAFRIYETSRKIDEAIIQTISDSDLYLQLFLNEIITLSRFAIQHNFIPRVSSEEEQLLKDNAELLQRIFEIVNNR